MPRVRAIADAAVVSFGSGWAAALGALLALASVAMIVLSLTVGGASDGTDAKRATPSRPAGIGSPITQPGVRYDGGPEEGGALSRSVP
jgi:hypothetical protein